MTCDVCPHWQEVKAALDFCQFCGSSGNGHLYQLDHDNACRSCNKYKEVMTALKYCRDCEAGKLHGQVNYDTAIYTAKRADQPSPRNPAEAVTTLSPEVEDDLRHALMTIFDWNEIEILLLRHIMHGGSFAGFKTPLRHLRERLGKYDLADENEHFRATAQCWANGLIEKYPPIGQLIKAAISENSFTKTGRRAEIG